MALKKKAFERTQKDISPADMAGEAPLCRSLPQDINAERGLLGSILVDPGRVMDLCVSKGLVPEAFVDPIHRNIYIAIEKLASKGQPVDGITVSNYLTGMGELENVGGIATLSALVASSPTSAHAGYYADLVIEQYLRRSIIGTVRKIEEDVYDSSLTANYVLGNAEQSILRLSNGHDKEGSVADWKTTVTETVAALKRLFENPKSLSGLPTGFLNLDEKLRGMHKGEMIVLAARPSMGKTSLAMNIAECVARGRDIFSRPFPSATKELQKHGVLVFSLEMTQLQLSTRMLCGLAGVSSYDIERSYVKKSTELPKLESAARELADIPIRCDDQSGIDVLELRARARHIHKKAAIELIVIDYLQLLNHREFAKQGRQIETSKISGEIKAMAKELNVPVIILSQLSRAPEQRPGADEKPKCSDLRDSGAIEQDADVVMLLRRPCKMARSDEKNDEKLAIIDIAKNRNGPTGEVRMNFDGKLTRFCDRVETNPNYSSADMRPENEPPTPQEA
ncbi:MAG: replicative DNA helicase [Kiritimatiellia bacterium]